MMLLEEFHPGPPSSNLAFFYLFVSTGEVEDAVALDEVEIFAGFQDLT